MPGKRSFHMALDVKGALTNWKANQFKGMFKDDNGRFLSPAEAKAKLLEELSKGHNMLPFGECDNFDYAEHGCMGHPVNDDSEVR